jgi:hypothetical protein
MPLSGGMFDRNDLNALRPPADAPMPTIRPPSLSFDLERPGAVSLLREAADPALAAARLPSLSL